MPTELTNEQVFKLICIEAIESMGLSMMSPKEILRQMNDPDLIDECAINVFVRDDVSFDEQENFLFQWMLANRGNEALRLELEPIAERLEKQIRS
jgi:hypothetical protein